MEYIPVPESGCWLWEGPVFCNGYGRVGNNRAHRVSYEKAKGPIPAGMIVCHKCDTRLCINPAHLFLGTNETNMADMVRKGRSARNEKHGMAKLTIEKAEQIRKSKLSVRQAATLFGVSKSTISNIRMNIAWRV